jgi:cell division transport system ATP-binding protein
MSQNAVINLKGVAVYQPEDEFSKLTLRNSMQVLSDVNLEIGEGEMVYFIGKVGSGKTSLIKTLYAELPILVGEAEVVGYNLASLRKRDISALRRKVGVVFQDYRLLRDRNVYENLRFVMRATGWKNENEILARAEELLERVGLEGKMSKRPFELSGGEQQRLMIARALINEPDVIIADEPTGNLDPKSADDIMRLFVSIVEKGCSVVMATHNVQLIARYPARTYMFRKGHIAQVDSERLASL